MTMGVGVSFKMAGGLVKNSEWWSLHKQQLWDKKLSSMSPFSVYFISFFSFQKRVSGWIRLLLFSWEHFQCVCLPASAPRRWLAFLQPRGCFACCLCQSQSLVVHVGLLTGEHNVTYIRGKSPPRAHCFLLRRRPSKWKNAEHSAAVEPLHIGHQ